jgi:hypothetical protein
VAFISCEKIYILNTFAPNFDNELKGILLQALHDDIRVKVLLLNPWCEEIRYRQATLPEWKDIGVTIQENVIFLQGIYNEAQKEKSEGILELRLYTSWAPFSLYATDQGASVGFFMNGELAVKGPQLIITKNTRYFKKFINQFDKIWDTEEKLFDFPRNDPMRVLDECYSKG